MASPGVEPLWARRLGAVRAAICPGWAEPTPLAAGLGSPQVEGYGMAVVLGGGSVVGWRSESKANQFKPFHLKAVDFYFAKKVRGWEAGGARR